jgi:hypothetical protein
MESDREIAEAAATGRAVHQERFEERFTPKKVLALLDQIFELWIKLGDEKRKNEKLWSEIDRLKAVEADTMDAVERTALMTACENMINKLK